MIALDWYRLLVGAGVRETTMKMLAVTWWIRGALACGLWAVGLFVPAGAAEVQGLYEARVPVVSQGEGERRAAIRSAFEEVLVKVTGDRGAPSLPRLEAALDQPLRFVQQFRYRPLDEGGDDGDGEVSEYTQTIRVTFDPRAVNGLLQEAEVPVWGRTRPTILLWLAVEDEGGRYLVGADARSPLAGLVLREADRRGLPVLLPLLDLVDQRRISFTDVWGNFEDAVLEASARYQTGAVLVGRLYRASADDWTARWSLYQDKRVSHWQLGAARSSDVAAAGIDGAADALGQRYAQLLSTEDTRSVELVVSDIRDLDGYARAMKYLRRLDPVSNVAVASVEPDRIRFRLTIQGDRAGLEQTIGFGDTLVPVRDQPASVALGEQPSGVRELSYRLLP